MKKLLFSPGAAPNLPAGCISYPKLITIAGIFLALRLGRQTNPAARPGDAPQGSPAPFSSWRARRDRGLPRGRGSALTRPALCYGTWWCPQGHGDVSATRAAVVCRCRNTPQRLAGARGEAAFASGCDCTTSTALFTSHADTRSSQQSPLDRSCPSLQTFLWWRGRVLGWKDPRVTAEVTRPASAASYSPENSTARKSRALSEELRGCSGRETSTKPIHRFSACKTRHLAWPTHGGGEHTATKPSHKGARGGYKKGVTAQLSPGEETTSAA